MEPNLSKAGDQVALKIVDQLDVKWSGDCRMDNFLFKVHYN